MRAILGVKRDDPSRCAVCLVFPTSCTYLLSRANQTAFAAIPPRYHEEVRFDPGPNTKPGYRWCWCEIVCRTRYWVSKRTWSRHRKLAINAGYLVLNRSDKHQDNDDDDDEREQFGGRGSHRNRDDEGDDDNEPPRKRMHTDIEDNNGQHNEQERGRVQDGALNEDDMLVCSLILIFANLKANNNSFTGLWKQSRRRAISARATRLW